MNRLEIDRLIENIGAEAALKRAISRGGDLADLFFEEVGNTTLVLEAGRLEKIISGQETGVGLRVVFDGRQALAATNDLSPAGLLAAAGDLAQAVSQGRPLTIDRIRPGILESAFSVQKRPETVATAEKIEYLRRAEATARAWDPRVRQVRVAYADRIQRVVIVDSRGVVSSDERIGLVFMVQVVAGSGDLIQVGQESIGGRLGLELFAGTDPEEVARRAAARAVLLLEADEAPSGPMPVVLSSEAGGTMIHEAIGHGLEADLALEGLSAYAGRIGQSVASELITVIDDATLPGRRGSLTIDDEGTPGQVTVLVEKGVLKRYMSDRRTALMGGVASTGNGRRESFRHRPVVRMTNTLIAPGTTDPAAILAATPTGLFARKMGGGQVNTVTGDFVFEVAEGYLIENGRLGRPIRGASLTGNGPELLKQIDMVGSDLGFGLGTCGKDGQGVPVADAQPTLRLPEIIVGGRGRSISGG